MGVNWQTFTNYQKNKEDREINLVDRASALEKFKLFKTGETVYHPSFGNGVVVWCAAGDNAPIIISFGGEERKFTTDFIQRI